MISLIYVFINIDKVFSDSLTFEKIYSFSNSDDSGFDIEIDKSENIYICGSTTNPFYSGILFKLNSKGNIIWQNVLNRNNLTFYDLKISNDNFIYVCGSYDSAFIAKFDLNGKLIWFNTFFEGRSNFYKIIQLSNKEFITCGDIYPDNGIIVKFDNNGKLLDSLKTGFKNIPLVKSIENNSHSDFLALKYRYFNNMVTPVISKYDNNLNLLNEIEFQDRILQILRFTNGFMLCGWGLDTTINRQKALFIKIDNSLNLQYRNLSEETGFSITPFTEINKSIVYYYENRIGDSLQINYIMTDSLGKTIRKTSRIFFLENSFLYRSVTAIENFIYFTGDKYFPVDGTVLQDIILTKTDQYFNFKTVNIKNSSQFLNFVDVSIFPNPFNNFIRLNITGNIRSHIKIKIFDIRGRLVYGKDINFINSQNELTEIIELNNLSSGIYYLQIQNIDFSLSKKLVNIK